MVTKKKYINKKTGQITSEPNKNLGTTQEYSPRTAANKTYNIGDKQVSKEEYKQNLEESRIIAAGGHKARTQQELIDVGLKPGITTVEKEKEAVPVPRAEPIAEQTAQPFAPALKENTQELTKKLGPIGFIEGVLAQTTLGQSLAGQNFAQSLKDEATSKSVLDLTKYMQEKGLRPEQVTSDPTAQAILSMGINERDIKVLEQGKADVSAFAVALEGSPIVGQLAKWTGGAILPTSSLKKVRDLDKEVEAITSTMDNWTEAISKNPQKAAAYGDLVDESEQLLLDVQSRMKLLIIQSPTLQNSPEEVELIQQNLDKALLKTVKLRSQIIDARSGNVA